MVVFVMGSTGVGKSTFIEALVGENAGASHGLTSATDCLGIHCYMHKWRRVFLVDTPGFNATRSSNTDVYKEIAFFLGRLDRCEMSIGGMVYLHRITDNRISGSAERSFALLREICGAEGARHTVLATTMWDNFGSSSTQYQESVEREKRLKITDAYWGFMARKGIRTHRWLGTRSSALEIISGVIQTFQDDGPAAFKIQRELLEEGRHLDNTSPGRELSGHNVASRQHLKEAIEEMRLVNEKEFQGQDEELLLEIQSLERELRQLEQAERGLKETFEATSAERSRKYFYLFKSEQKEMRKLDKDVEDMEMQLRKQKLRERGNAEAHVEPSPPPYEMSWQPRLTGKQKQDLENELEKKKKRKVFKRNTLAIVGMLGGAATIAAGAATMQIPVVAAGIALFGTAGLKLDLSKKKKRKRKRRGMAGRRS